MAFEDRCSPQSAPSPPGVPHSPQNSTSANAMICTSSSTNGSPIGHEMSLSISAAEHLSMHVRVKQEDGSSSAPSSPDVTNESQPINFSITKILSDNFGKVNSSRKSSSNSEKVGAALFRPYDMNEILTNSGNSSASKCVNKIASAVHKLTHYRRNSLSPSESAIDFSRSNDSLENAKNSLFASFNVTSYPKIHDEIVNNAKHKYHHLQQHYHHLAESAFSKIPPLGNLCKTVSQIGQSSSISPTIKNDLLPSPTSSTSQQQQHQQTTPHHHQQNALPSSSGRDSGMDSSDDTKSESGSSTKDGDGAQLWPAWVYCTRYSDRPSSGPRYRKPKTPKEKTTVPDEKRPRTAFSSDQLARLKREFTENRYLTERRRQQLSAELGLNEAQIKIWFQNKRAKIKKSTGSKNPLALQLMAQGLYNHSTVPLTKEEEELEMRMNGQL